MDNIRTRWGFTLLELLTCLAVVGLLVSLLSVAVGSAREAARRTDCSNRMRQIVLGFQSHFALNGTLPTIQVLDTDASFWFELSDELEMGLDVDDPQFRFEVGFQPDFVPPLLHCPTDDSIGANYRYCTGSSLAFEPAITGSTPRCADGVGIRNMRALSVASVSDGLSQTALLSERLVARNIKEPRRSVVMGPYLPNITAGGDPAIAIEFLRENWAIARCSNDSGQDWSVAGHRSVGYNHLLPPNDDLAGTFNGGNRYIANFGCIPASSDHPAGVGGATADGAVHFWTDTIDQRLWTALATRAGGELTP